MRLSTSIKNNALEVASGFLLNTFKFKKRRGTVFFEDLLSEYIRKCEISGHEKEIEEIGKRWMVLYFANVIPEKIKSLPPLFILNDLMRKIWMNLGLTSDFRVFQEGNKLVVNSRNEGITRIIGQNRFVGGTLHGIFGVLFKRDVKSIEVKQSIEKSEYIFQLQDKTFMGYASKGKKRYDLMNSVATVEGFNLKSALNNKTVVLSEDNRIYFRGRPLWYVENTLFHLIGNADIIMDEVPEISYKYFIDFVEETTVERKLSFLKNFLQMMGWGLVNIIFEKGDITLEIRNPPYGLQIERDNWSFLLNVILGYLWTIEKNYKMTDVREVPKNIFVKYSI